MTGNLFLAAGMVAALAAMFICFTQKIPSAKQVKISVIISAACVIAASLELWYFIFSDNFSVEYVASYSSKDLPTVYKISAFWAGQQGAFLFWLLIHAIVGVILTFRRTSAAALGIYFFLQNNLSFLVLVKSPFLENSVALVDGVGLNPLLQDPWAAIHPPVIFTGYALLAVPITLSLGNLLSEPNSNSWLEPARRWTLTAWAFLGAGIFIGGYWAWDSLENSSLVPWLLCAVLLHLINLAKSRPPVWAVTHVAATFAYSAVIYGTFLTYSGNLGNLSFHSFTDSSIGMTMAMVDAIILIGGLTIIFGKVNLLPQGESYKSFAEPAFIILLSSLIFVVIAAIVWLGMSMPLLTQLVGVPATVDTDFYVKTTAPLVLILIISMAYLFLKLRMKTSLGGKIAHVGFVAGLAAIVISSTGETITQNFEVRAENEILGHKIIYEGQVFSEEGTEKFYVYNIDGQIVRALTKLRASGEDAAREPAILKTFAGDVYIAPHSTENFGVQELILEKGKFSMDGELGYIFEKSEIKRDENDFPVSATAIITVTDGESVEKIKPLITVTQSGGTSKAIEIFDKRRRVRLTGISSDEQKARLEILPTVEKLSNLPVTATVSTKPFIWLLWLSVTAVCLGTLLAVKRKH